VNFTGTDKVLLFSINWMRADVILLASIFVAYSIFRLKMKAAMIGCVINIICYRSGRSRV
jgi:hypothetical protein